MALNLDAVGKPFAPLTKDYTWKDAVLYALGVGAGFDELEYCFEQQLKVIPSFSIASVFDFLAEAGISSNADLTGATLSAANLGWVVWSNTTCPDGSNSDTNPKCGY